MPSVEVQVVRMWEWQSWDIPQEEKIYIICDGFVAAFYLYYFWDSISGYCREGSKYFTFLNILQIVNFVFFCAQVGCRAYSTKMVPKLVDVDSWDFIDFIP